MTHKTNFTIPISIGLVTAILTVGMNWGIMKSKADEVDKVKSKADTTELKVVALETKIDDLKDDMKDLKNGIKDILKAVKR